MKLALVGESYTLRSPAAACQQTLNLLPQIIDDPNEHNKNKAILELCPGYHLLKTLPTSPIRGMFSGGGRLFVVAGSHFYEVGLGSYVGGNPSTGAGTIISDFDMGANDGKPVQMFGNGTQLLIIANGLAYINNGSGPVVAQFQISGLVNTNGTDVQWVSGDDFSTFSAGNVISIDGTPYSITTVNSATDLTISASAGIQNGAVFNAAVGGNVTAVTGAYLDSFFIVQRPAGLPFTGTCNTSGVNVSYLSGSTFASLNPGDGIVINGVGYTVAVQVGPLVLILTASAGPQTGASFGFGEDLGRQFNISAPGDGTNWDPLDFASKEADADDIQSIMADREQLYLFGTESQEVWQDVGDPTFPFARIPGAAATEGSVARYGPVSTGQRVYYMGGSPRGQAVAFRLDGFTPVRVSTHAVEAAWATAGDSPSEARAYAMVDDGHKLWVVNFQGSLNTWVYDETASEQAGTPIWHQRAEWTGTAFAPYRPQFHTFIPEWGPEGYHIVGDFGSGKLWEMNLSYPDQDGSDMAWVRTFPALYAAGMRQYFGRMTLEMATGTTSSATVQPLITRSYSDDRGQTFVNPVTQPVGVAGAFNQRVFWPSNGSSYDRVFQLSGVGQYPVTLIDLELDVEVGTA